jgi:hypothetical protein
MKRNVVASQIYKTQFCDPIFTEFLKSYVAVHVVNGETFSQLQQTAHSKGNRKCSTAARTKACFSENLPRSTNFLCTTKNTPLRLSVWLRYAHAGEQQFKEPRRLGPLFFSTCAVRVCVSHAKSRSLMLPPLGNGSKSF